MVMSDKQFFDFIIYMTLYGILFGLLVGFFGGMPLSLMMLDESMSLHNVGSALLGGVIGSILGMVYGIFTGFTSGVMMLTVTHIFFRVIHRQRLYKLMMGVVTIISTAFYLMIFPVWLFFKEAGFTLVLMSLGFAIHASQRVAHDYLREIHLRKSKAKIA